MKKRILAALLCLCMVVTLLPTVAFAVVDRYEAENATLSVCTVADDAAASGGKYVGMTSSGESITFGNVTVSAAGNYAIIIRYKAADNKQNKLSVNDGQNKILTFTQSSTFTDLETTMSLNQGTNIIVIEALLGHIDVDYIEIAPAR